jgi:hypothetical protein
MEAAALACRERPVLVALGVLAVRGDAVAADCAGVDTAPQGVSCRRVSCQRVASVERIRLTTRELEADAYASA